MEMTLLSSASISFHPQLRHFDFSQDNWLTKQNGQFLCHTTDFAEQ